MSNIKYLFLFIFFSLGSVLFAQEYNFQYINQSQGLSNTFVNDIVQDDRGYLFISTGEGVGIYNGQKVTMHTKENGLTDNYVTKSYKDSKGNIWFGHIQGGSSIYYEGKFGKVHVGAGIDSQINDIDEDEDGRIWFVAQNYGLYFYTEDITKDFFPKISGEKQYYSLLITEDHRFLIGTDQGIEVYQFSGDIDGNHLSKTQQIEKVSDLHISDIIFHHEKILAFTKNGIVYQIIEEDGYFTSKEIVFSNLNNELMITDVYSHKNNLWINTLQNGLLKCQLSDNKLFISEKFNKKSGLKTNAINTTLVDRENVLWIGTYGEGLASKEDDIFTYYFIDKKVDNPISSLITNETNIYVASDGKIQHYDKQNTNILQTYNQSNGLPNDQINKIIFDKDSNLYIGTSLNGVYRLLRGETNFEPIQISSDYLANTISDIEIQDNYLFIATLNGAYRYDLNSGGITVYNITTGLPHNSIGAIYQSKKGEIYFGTNSAFISKLTDSKIINYPIIDGEEVIEVNDIHEDKDGNIWFSSNGHGVFKLIESENGCVNFNKKDGLMSNYCNCIRILGGNNLWTSHNDGLSNFSISDSTFQLYDEYFGLTNRFLRASVDLHFNELWFGTENGIVMYNKNNDVRNKVPPITTLRYLTINDTLYETDKPITLPYGAYKFGFGLAGLTLKGSKQVTFQFQLEGYDDSWSDQTDKNSIYYTGMYDGEYTFRVKCFNADGTEGNEVNVRIIIEEPYWKKWWFYVSCFAVLVTGIYIIIKYRERSFIKYQEKLKRDLALRTREVVEQKNKIEEINKDLTDSINYAQRIQGSILPSDQYLKELFPKSFVFFRPRDIVSGDFYWAGEVDNKKILVCADCTGHGVPGGFMSMISHILIREALTPEILENPAKILQQIDRKIVEVLKQTDDLNSNHDGLDIAIIIKDDDNNEVKFCGAMRPLYLYRKGTRNIIKGDRYSLGGMSTKKTFETKVVQTQPGDQLYIFSDGFPDQFGGPRRSKMKLKVFQEYMDQICQLPMNNQGKELASLFDEWKGDHPQMDDVLVMGIEI